MDGATIQSAAAEQAFNRHGWRWVELFLIAVAALADKHGAAEPCAQTPATSASASSPTITACFGGHPCSQAPLQRTPVQVSLRRVLYAGSQIPRRYKCSCIQTERAVGILEGQFFIAQSIWRRQSAHETRD
jgi:hypothetical protein